MFGAIDLPFELILLLVAAIIGGINKLLETSRAMRKKSLERQQREGRTEVQLEEPPQPARRRIRRRERPEGEVELPIPEFGVPLPIPTALAPKPEIRKVEAPRRPRPPKPRLQLGTTPMPPARPVTPRRPVRARKKVVPRRARALGLGDLKRVREAIVLREILGPPVALRGRRPR